MSLNIGRMARPGFWLVGLVALGLALRLCHYLSNPAVWHDEAALLMNVLAKGFAELLGPLFYAEAGPPLFLWLERGVALTLGDGTFAMRLLPLLASCAALVGMVLIVRRLLPPVAVLWFTVLFGCSDRLLWHCCEAKPYAIDVLVAVGLLALFIGRKSEDPVPASLGRRLLLCGLLSPFLIFLSFPSCFLLGGAALVLLPAVWRSRSGRIWTAYLLFGGLLCGSFLLLVAGPVHAQKNELMLNCWLENFPTWDRPWKVPLQAVVRLTEVFRYASEPVGNVLFAFAVAGAVQLWRDGRRRLLGFLLAPLGLTAVAWLARQYPFGPARVVVFAAPAALLLVAAGVGPVLAWWGRRVPLAVPALVGLLLFPMAQAGYRIAVPWNRLDAATPAAFVLQKRQPSEPVVGLLWEHAYYFRGLGPLYRPLRPQPTDPPPLRLRTAGEVAGNGPAAMRLWLVGDQNATIQHGYLRELSPPHGWHITAKYDFSNCTALYLEREAPDKGPVAE